MARFGADTATCEVFTFREGVLAAAGHDLKLHPERFEIEADANIERSCAGEVLEAHRFPEIAFTSSEVRPGSVRGTLSLHGRELSGEFAVKNVEGRAIAEVELDVRRFGIRPYTTMFGALRVSPMVRVVVTTPWPDV